MKNIIRHLIRPTLLFGIIGNALAIPAYAQASEKAGDIGAGALGAILVVVLFTLAIAGLSLVWKGLFPRRVEWTGEIIRRMPWGSFFFGLLVGVVLLILIAILAQGGETGGFLAAILLAVVLFLFGGSGLASVTEWIGEMVDPASVGIRKALLGSSAWTLMVCIPILGWALMIGLLLAGIGAAMVAYVPPRPIQQATPPGDNPQA